MGGHTFPEAGMNNQWRLKVTVSLTVSEIMSGHWTISGQLHHLAGQN